MALNFYLQTTRRLLNDVVFAQFNDFDLVDWVNIARQQIAGEGECVRLLGALNLVVGQRIYPFSAITFGAAAGIGAVNNVRQLFYTVFGTNGYVYVNPREFEWFGLYNLNVSVPTSGFPVDWAQLGQGQNGTLFIDPLPDNTYVCALDLAAAPLALTNDTDIEAIPLLWQHAVPYFAAYMALLTKGSADAAQAMYQQFEMYMSRARGAATPSVLPHQYPQMPRQQDTAATTAPVRRIGIN